MSSASPINVVCIKWGEKYPAYYVNRLYRGVGRFLDRPFTFHCFTDRGEGIDSGVVLHDLPREDFEAELVSAMQRRGRKGAWRKVSLFRPGLAGMKGQMLGFDLDVVITGDLAPLVDAARAKVAMRREWRYAWKGLPGGHGSVFVFDPALHPYLYEDFAKDPVGSVAANKGSEQYYTSMSAYRRGQLVYLPNDMVASFKYDAARPFPLNHVLAPRLPRDCRVMCFHGRPKMEDAVEGFRGGPLESTLAADWLRRYWVEA